MEQNDSFALDFRNGALRKCGNVFNFARTCQPYIFVAGEFQVFYCCAVDVDDSFMIWISLRKSNGHFCHF